MGESKVIAYLRIYPNRRSSLSSAAMIFEGLDLHALNGVHEDVREVSAVSFGTDCTEIPRARRSRWACTNSISVGS